jgi:dihydrofolate synthase/folylpolyglutamate synthase
VVIGEKDSETKNVFIEIAKEKEAPIYFAEDRFLAQDYRWEADLFHINIKDSARNETKVYCIDLPGIYQAKNICTVLQSVAILKNKFSFNDERTKHALVHVKGATGFFGRWEVIGKNPKTVLDVAHNEPGIKELMRQLAEEDFEGLHIVFGMVKDKEADKVLSLLPKDAAYYFTQAHIPRALPADDLREKAGKFGLIGEVYENVNKAMDNCKKNATTKDLILVCGSIFLIAEVHQQNEYSMG